MNGFGVGVEVVGGPRDRMVGAGLLETGGRGTAEGDRHFDDDWVYVKGGHGVGVGGVFNVGGGLGRWRSGR